VLVVAAVVAAVRTAAVSNNEWGEVVEAVNRALLVLRTPGRLRCVS